MNIGVLCTESASSNSTLALGISLKRFAMIAPAEPLPTIMVSNSWLWRRVHIHLTALLASFSSAKVTLKVLRPRGKTPIVCS